MELSKQGIDAVYFELGLQGWDGDGLESELYLRANDWVFLDGVDRSKYRGVSLGKLFSRDISFIYTSFSRLSKSLAFFCEKYKPKDIYFFDFRSEVGMLDGKAKLSIVSNVCSEYDIGLINCSDFPAGDDNEFPQKLVYGNNSGQIKPKNLIKSIYYSVWCLISDVLNFTRAKRNRVVIMTGGHLAKVLSRQNFSFKTEFIYFIPVLKKSPVALLKTLLNGNILKKFPTISERKHRVELECIYDIYNDYWDKSDQTLLDKVVSNYIKANIFGKSRIEFYCSQIDATSVFLNATSPKKILIDSVFGADSRVPMELANQLGIKVEYIWHGFWQHVIRFDALSGDIENPPIVDRVYTWGEQNERWLEAVGWNGENKRVGNPFVQKYVSTAKKKVVKRTRKNVLVLQYTPMNTDIKGLNANQYGYLVDVVRILNNIGGLNVRVKLHPGVWKKSYYLRIVNFFGLTCDVFDDGPFEKHVDWADVVIGPAQSGAFLEVLAADKPYYPVVMPPQSTSVAIKSAKVYEGIAQLKKDLVNGVLWDQGAALEELCSSGEITNQAWELMKGLEQ